MTDGRALPGRGVPAAGQGAPISGRRGDELARELARDAVQHRDRVLAELVRHAGRGPGDGQRGGGRGVGHRDGEAAHAELLLADDVSSALDAATEIELWESLRERGTTVVGATSKRAALARADRVVVLDEGRVAAVGPWSELAPRWGHLAG